MSRPDGVEDEFIVSNIIFCKKGKTLMKKMRKLAGLLLAMVMVFAMTAVAFAAETYSITIENKKDDHIYEAYQIFVGDLHIESAEDGEVTKTLSNVQWGANANQKGSVTDDVLDGLTAENADTYVDFATTPVATSTDKGDAYVIEGLAAGYYLVKDEDNTLTGSDDAYTCYILEVVEDSTVSPKSDVPEVEKKVDDKNDSNNTEDTTAWQDSADYDIGDAVPFQLKATLADNVEVYDTYKIVFHDTLSEGLTYNDDAKVFFGETNVTEHFTITEKDGQLTISCDNVKKFGATNSSVITVEYTARLNDKAVLGAAGNPNVVYLEYSNNPNWKPEGDETPGNTPTGETPEDKVIVFTYKVVVNKVDENSNPLTGAGFTLYKKNADGEYVAVGQELFGAELTTFKWSGLDDGDYKLEETTTPAGYNTIAPIEFTITAEHDILSDDPRLTALSGTVASGEVTFTADVNEGSLATNVVNKTGATLPETGGMGTTLFYVIGAGLVIGAAVIMITKKRMNAN